MADKTMNPVNITAFDLQDAWFQAIWKCLDYGRERMVAKGGSFEGQRRKEFDFVTIIIQNPGHRPLAPIIPEHLGLPQPSNDEEIERYFTDYLFSPNKKPDEDYTYGHRLIGIVDQVSRAIELHRIATAETGVTNQATMEIAMSSDIHLSSPPCLRIIDTQIIEGQLWFFVYFRSWDLWAGFPTNLGGLQLLKEFMAKEIGVDDGGMVAMSKGLHLYDHCWEIAKIRTGKR